MERTLTAAAGASACELAGKRVDWAWDGSTSSSIG